MHYCLDNSGTFSVLDPVNGYTTFSGLCPHRYPQHMMPPNAWMECLFTDGTECLAFTIVSASLIPAHR